MFCHAGHNYLHNNTDFYTLEGEPASALAERIMGRWCSELRVLFVDSLTAGSASEQF